MRGQERPGEGGPAHLDQPVHQHAALLGGDRALLQVVFPYHHLGLLLLHVDENVLAVLVHTVLLYVDVHHAGREGGGGGKEGRGGGGQAAHHDRAAGRRVLGLAGERITKFSRN